MLDALPPLRIATRASALALWQAEHVAQLLREVAIGRTIELVHVSTHGDREQKEALSEMGGVGVFTREVQKAVLDKTADIAVHSLKDLPTRSAEGLVLAGVPERASVFDALVLPLGQNIKSGWNSLPQGARVGTGSLRRQAQVRHQRPDLVLLEVRGNVPTRLEKLDRGEYDAIILAQAGLDRLELSDRISVRLGPPEMYPAVGQGALGIECREEDAETIRLLAEISDPIAFASIQAERALLAELEAGCHAPLGALTTAFAAERELRLEAVVLHPNGAKRLVSEMTGSLDDPVRLGQELAEELRALGADDLMKA
jgi:hydroxymethylbilane synthase